MTDTVNWHHRTDGAVRVEIAPGCFVNIDLAEANGLLPITDINAVRAAVRRQERAGQEPQNAVAD